MLSSGSGRFGLIFLLGSAAGSAAAQSALPAVFVANNVSDSISSFSLNPDGTLEFVGNATTSDGPQTIDLSPDGRYVVVGHGTANDVEEVLTIFAVGGDASLTEEISIMVPDSPLDAVWLSDAFLAVTETNVGPPNFVHVYRFNPAVPALSLIDTEATGSFNSALLRHPDGTALYAQDSFTNLVLWFGVAPDGALSPGGTLPTGATFPLELAAVPDASFLYAAGGISNGGHFVLGFSVAGDGGLAALPGSPYFSPGQSPAHVAAGTDWLFVGHGTDATVHSLAIGPTGALAATGFSFDVGLQGTIGDVLVLGEFLLVTDESTAIDGISGIYSFLIGPDGSLSPAGPIEPAQGVRPESMAGWIPPSSVPGDLDGDGEVGVTDLLIVLGAWGPCADPCPPSCQADTDRDCAVGVTDLLLVLAHWTG